MLQKLKHLFLRQDHSEHKTAQVFIGEPIEEQIRRLGTLRYTEHIHTCCRCGLKHRVRIEIGRKSLRFKYWEYRDD